MPEKAFSVCIKDSVFIDYACGAGHFLTQGYEAIEAWYDNNYPLRKTELWVDKKLYGIEKDYRLARVSKISLFMHGAGEGNIIFGDGLENYKDKNITPNSFDVLVANPPYSVSSFKPHLKLNDNDFEILPAISNSGSEIETLFVERIAQLLKPDGIAAVILPSPLLAKENESFIKARESLLKNFLIKAIARFGNKTFGATGSNTFVLFIQKYDEPPKRIDLIQDSVQAILDSRDLSGWEDDIIFNAYLKRIGVGRELYKSFIKEEIEYDEWEDEYFRQYYSVFVSSTEFTNKQKQKTFKKLTEDEKRIWETKQFYSFAKNLEKEKLIYFSLIYNQTTLIINAPDDNKEQEKFLGYTWSNRKGQEGIQIKKAGGMLYDDKNRYSEETLSGVVRNTFSNQEVEIEELKKYYYYLPTSEMIEFRDVKFNKAIKTTKLRNLEAKPGMKVYKLSNSMFELTIGKRVTEEELENTGIPVYSANVYEPMGTINKELLDDFSKPSVLWGIDGDWMVSCLQENVEFYPTDHCGVLRVNSDDILPKYLAAALQVEGEYERFSRTNRASIDRVKALSIQVPSKTIQKEIVKSLDVFDEKIEKEKEAIHSIDEDTKQHFIKMFNLKEYMKDGISSLYEMKAIENLCDDGRGRVINTDYIEEHFGEFPVYSSQTSNDGIFGYIDTYDFDGEYVTWTTDGANAGTVFYRNGKFNCTNVCGTLKAKVDEIDMKYLAYALSSVTHLYVNHVGNDKLMNAPMKKIKIPVPPINEQRKFSKYFDEATKKKSDHKETIRKLQNERSEYVKKRFE